MKEKNEHALTLRFPKTTKKKLEILRQRYYINISEYLRESIDKLYDEKVNKE